MMPKPAALLPWLVLQDDDDDKKDLLHSTLHMIGADREIFLDIALIVKVVKSIAESKCMHA